MMQQLLDTQTGSASSKYVVYATACVYRELYGKITDHEKLLNNYLIWNKFRFPGKRGSRIEDRGSRIEDNLTKKKSSKVVSLKCF